MKYQCPNGHTVEATVTQTVYCHTCDLIATNVSRRDGVAAQWLDYDEFVDQRTPLQDFFDEACDNQHFDGGLVI